MKSFKTHLGEARKRAPKLKPDSIKTIRAQDKKNMPDGWDTKRKKPRQKTMNSTQKSMADIRAKARAQGLPEDTQLDELSKKTLGSYIKKASRDMGSKMGDDQHYTQKGANSKNQRDKNKNYDKADAAFRKASKRQMGVDNAVKRLTK